MIDHIPSLASLIDRCAHRAAMHLRTKTALLNNSAPIVSFTFNDVPGERFSRGRGNSRRPRSRRHVLHRGGAFPGGADCNSDGRSLITSPECLELHRRGHRDRVPHVLASQGGLRRPSGFASRNRA